MQNRREFIKSSLAGLSLMSLGHFSCESQTGHSGLDAEALKRKNLKTIPDGRSGGLIRSLNRHPDAIKNVSTVAGCLENGYAPRGYGIADFSIFREEGLFHLFHIPKVPGAIAIDPANEHWFGHAVSEDLNTWITRDPVFFIEPANHYESAHVWAPFIYRKNERAYMFYTGLSGEPSQVLCIAQADQSDLTQWKRYEKNPIVPLEGFDWHYLNHKGHVRHARDAHVVRVQDHYLMAYTAMHVDGCPAVGGMVSRDLLGWEDIGPILFRPMHPATWLPESVNIQQLEDGTWALIPSQSPGMEYYISADPHHWHGEKPTPIEYTDGDNKEPVAIEVISKQDDAWLVAFFELSRNRLFIGRLDIAQHPWRLTRIRETGELSGWDNFL